MKAVGRPENQKGQAVIQGLLKEEGFASIPTKIRGGGATVCRNGIFADQDKAVKLKSEIKF